MNRCKGLTTVIVMGDGSYERASVAVALPHPSALLFVVSPCARYSSHSFFNFSSVLAHKYYNAPFGSYFPFPTLIPTVTMMANLVVLYCISAPNQLNYVCESEHRVIACMFMSFAKQPVAHT